MAPRRALALLALPLLLGGFAGPDPRLAAPAPVFEPERFFLGRTEGQGTVHEAFSKAGNLGTIGVGRVDADGTLVLTQKVIREGHDPDMRQWRIRKVSPGRYSGTLTDATGPVTADVTGNMLHIRYRVKKGNFQAEQFVYLQRDGRTALNRMTIRKFGLPVATVEETIRRIG